MNSTNTPIFIANEFPKWVASTMLKAMDDSTRRAYQIIWSGFISILAEHWLSVVIFLVVVLFISIVFAVKGYWGMLGSVLYHYLYFGILFIVGLLFDSDIFVSNFFSVVCTIILYPVCYWITGFILVRTGLKRRKEGRF